MLADLPIDLYREVKPFPIWFYIPLLDNDVSLHYLVALFVASSTSQRSLKTKSRRKSYERFGVGGFTHCSLYRGQTFAHLVLNTLLDTDFSLHILVLLVVLIPTSPRTSKTEFVCKSYRNFRIAIFPSLGGG